MYLRLGQPLKHISPAYIKRGMQEKKWLHAQCTLSLSFCTWNKCTEWTGDWRTGEQQQIYTLKSVSPWTNSGELQVLSQKSHPRFIHFLCFINCPKFHCASSMTCYKERVGSLIEIWFQSQQQKPGWSFRQTKITANRIPRVTGAISLPSVKSRTRERTWFIHMLLFIRCQQKNQLHSTCTFTL